MELLFISHTRREMFDRLNECGMVIYLVARIPEAPILILSLCRFTQTHNFTFHFSEHCGYLIQCVTPILVFNTGHKFLAALLI